MLYQTPMSIQLLIFVSICIAFQNGLLYNSSSAAAVVAFLLLWPHSGIKNLLCELCLNVSFYSWSFKDSVGQPQKVGWNQIPFPSARRAHESAGEGEDLGRSARLQVLCRLDGIGVGASGCGSQAPLYHHSWHLQVAHEQVKSFLAPATVCHIM